MGNALVDALSFVIGIVFNLYAMLLAVRIPFAIYSAALLNRFCARFVK